MSPAAAAVAAIRARTAGDTFAHAATTRPLESRWGPRKIAWLDRVIRAHTILLPDLQTADIWASVYTQRRRAGRPIQGGDCWIAATVLRHGVPLVTHNARDYADIPGLNVVKRGG